MRSVRGHDPTMTVALCLMSIFWVGTAHAQDTESTVSEPVAPYIIDADLRTLPRPRAWSPGMPIREIPRIYRKLDRDVLAPDRRDPLVDNQARGGTPDPTFSTQILNQDGQANSGSLIPDTVGDVGTDYFIQAVNGIDATQYTIYDKSDGSVVAGPFGFSDLAAGSPCDEGVGDPIVLYDRLADRWLISELAAGVNALCVYISQTSDPIAGGWYAYSFATSFYPDYPKYGVWPDGYYATANEDVPKIRVMDRQAMLAGLPATMITAELDLLAGFGFQSSTPADHDGALPPPEGAPGIVMRHLDDEIHNTPITFPDNDFLELYEIEVSFTRGTLALSPTIRIPIADFDSNICGTNFEGCIPQPGSSPKLDPLREVIMWRLSYRNQGSHEALVGNFTVDVDGNDTAGIRWFELRRTPESRTRDWTLYQEGTHSLDSTHRWMGAIAMDVFGNIALGYNVSDGDSVFPGLRYAGRLANEPLGTLSQGEHTVIAGAAANSSFRYGDYNSMSVDPVDDCTFWLTGQHNPAAAWSTRIATFSFDDCGCVAPDAPTTLTATPDGDNTIEVTWDAVAGAESYNVYRAIGDCPRETYALVAGDVTSTSYLDTDVTGGFSVAYAVRAYDADQDCLSGFSSCDTAQTSGDCLRAPVFEGITAITNLQRGNCSIEVRWSPADSGCNGPLTYNIYRSTASVFTPGPDNLIASCLTDTTYIDHDIDFGVRYYYIVSAEEVSGTGNGPCNGGGETYAAPAYYGTATAPDTIGFTDDLESGDGAWSTAAGPTDAGTDAWTLTMTGTEDNGTSWFCSDEGTVKDQRLALAAGYPIPTSARLRFDHAYTLESSAGSFWDGGVLEYSTDDGATWFDILAGNGNGIPANAGRFIQNGYVGTISLEEGNPLAGRRAFSGFSDGFLTTEVDLADLAGEDGRFRFRLGCDSSFGAAGWWVDNVTIIEPGACVPGEDYVCFSIETSLELWNELIDILDLLTCPDFDVVE